MGTLLCLMAILTANRDSGALQGPSDRRDVQRRRTNQKVGGKTLCAIGHTARQCDCLGRKAVHLPVPGNEL
jgi:hypothetical protein